MFAEVWSSQNPPLQVFRIGFFSLYIWTYLSASSLPDTWRGLDAAGSPVILRQQESGYVFSATRQNKLLHFTWKQVFLVLFFKPKFVISICLGRCLYFSCRYTLEMLFNIEYSQTNFASGKLLCWQIRTYQIMKYQHWHWRYDDAVI